MKRLKWLWCLPPLALSLLLLVQFGCSREADPWKGEPAKPRVVVTIPPLYSFVRAVAGDRAGIKPLCTSTGPHDYQTDYRDSHVMKGAHVVFAVGLELDEKFAESLHRMSARKDLPLIRLGDKLKERGMVHKMRPHKHEPGEDGAKPHSHGEYDPHVWLGIDQAVAMVDLIRDELCRVDPDYSAEYEKNARAYVERLVALKAEWAGRFDKKKVKRIISFHDAFEYFAGCFGLQIASVIELAPGQPPSQRHLDELVKLCSDKKKPIGAITTEPQYPDSSFARQLLTSLSLGTPPVVVDLVAVDPLETALLSELRAEGADWYVTRMRQNLESLDGVLK